MTSRLIREVIKNQSVVALSPDTSVEVAAQTMEAKRIGAVVVTEGAKMVGIFTERDGLFRVLAKGLDPAATTLSQVMTAKVTTISSDRRLLHALHIMQENSFRHLPVVDQGVPRGMLSIRDALDFELVHFLRDIERKEVLTEIL